MKNLDKLKIFKLIKFNMEKIIFVVCSTIIIVIVLKTSYLIYYHVKASKVFTKNTTCETYKSLYAHELNKGELANLAPILHQAKNESCLKDITLPPKTTEKEKEKESVENNDQNVNIYDDFVVKKIK